MKTKSVQNRKLFESLNFNLEMFNTNNILNQFSPSRPLLPPSVIRSKLQEVVRQYKRRYSLLSRVMKGGAATFKGPFLAVSRFKASADFREGGIITKCRSVLFLKRRDLEHACETNLLSIQSVQVKSRHVKSIRHVKTIRRC